MFNYSAQLLLAHASVIPSCQWLTLFFGTYKCLALRGLLIWQQLYCVGVIIGYNVNMTNLMSRSTVIKSAIACQVLQVFTRIIVPLINQR